MPGSPLDPRAAGTNDLIKQGATLVTEAADIINAVRRSWNGRSCSRRAKTTTSRSISTPPRRPRAHHDLLGPSPISLDDLIRMSGLSPTIVRSVLLQLELAGRLERHGGGLVSLI